MSWTVSLGQDIKNSIELPSRVAKETVKDILRGDSLKIEYSFLKKNYSLLEYNLTLKDSIISIKDSIILNSRFIINNQNKIISYKDEQNNNLTLGLQKLNNELKQEKRKNKVGGIISGAIIGGLIYMIFR